MKPVNNNNQNPNNNGNNPTTQKIFLHVPKPPTNTTTTTTATNNNTNNNNSNNNANQQLLPPTTSSFSAKPTLLFTASTVDHNQRAQILKRREAHWSNQQPQQYALPTFKLLTVAESCSTATNNNNGVGNQSLSGSTPADDALKMLTMKDGSINSNNNLVSRGRRSNNNHQELLNLAR